MSITLSSLPENYRSLIIGASGGIGKAFVEAVAADPRSGALFAASRSSVSIDGAQALSIDLSSETTIKSAVQQASQDGPLHLVIVASGILHDNQGISPEKTWAHLDGSAMAHVFAINTIGPALVAKHALPVLDKDHRSIFAALSARVGSISDNRLGGWHSYRASKAALNQIIRTCSIELARKNRTALCVGLHPGTVDTGLSEPFQSNVPDGKLFTPTRSATSLLSVLNGLDETDTGQCFDWAGERIDP